jgi:hypothetical protein
VSMQTLLVFLASAPNTKSFIGPSIFAVGADGSLMSEDEREQRLANFRHHFHLSDDAVAKLATEGSLPTDPAYAEWLVLMGRSDLL